ncbi:MAG: von Willebrand factor type A domain-containing protein [Verrucomicrobiota bacterium]
MNISKEDPILTAFALGEIRDPKERSEVEQVVAADPELEAEVQSIRSMSEQLSAAFHSEAVPELSEFEKASLQAVPEPKRSWVRVLISWPVVTTAAAAVLALLLIPQVGSVRFEEISELEQGQETEPVVSRYRELNVDIPTESIEGTPQPINVPGLEPAPTKAPRMLVPVQEGSAVSDRRLSGQDELELGLAESTKGKALGYVSGDEVSSSPGVVTESNLSTAAKPPRSRSFGAFADMDLTNSLAAPVPQAGERTEWNTEKYDPIDDTDFRSPLVAPLSTFSIDVDTASYANVRRFLNQGQLPPADAVRIEELVNYFSYTDAAPVESLEEGGDPFAVRMAQATAPWNDEHRLLRVALKGYEMPWEERPASNLVFLLDVSGSMDSTNKLPLVKEAMQILTDRLDQRDRVAIVVYAGASGLVLPSTTANNTETIEHALNQLNAGGSTNGGAGIKLAYKVARENFVEGGNNRVILCTDGDFNIGQTNRSELTEIASKEAEEGVSLTVLGFGMGNYKDDILEDLSNKGKGSYAYVDSRAEARKVFLEDLASNIFKIAKDVKIQVEFNPQQVQAYRLIGYENRRLKAEDFNNDKKKAGDIGPGHTVTAFYEIVPAGSEFELPGVDKLRYQQESETEVASGEVATVKLRYKTPEADKSRLIRRTAHSEDVVEFEQANDDFRFGAAVAAFGFKLRASDTIGEFSYAQIEQIATGAIAEDPGGHRSEFTDLVRKAEQFSK